MSKDTIETPKLDPNDEVDIWNNRRREIPLKTKSGADCKATVRRLGVVKGRQAIVAELSNDDEGLALLFIEEVSPKIETDQMGEWFNNLTPESQLDILEIGEEVNADFLEKLRAREKKLKERKAKAAGLTEEKVTQALAEKIFEKMSGNEDPPSDDPSTSSSEPDTPSETS